MILLPMVNQDFVIPADAVDYEVTQRFTLPPFASADLYLIAPHMHLLGQTISAELTLEDGTNQCLIDIPAWDFDWQQFYTFNQPVHLPGNTTLSMRATYDNSINNPNNPNAPPKDVGWGEETTDEMALVFFGVVAPNIITKENNPWDWPFPEQR